MEKPRDADEHESEEGMCEPLGWGIFRCRCDIETVSM